MDRRGEPRQTDDDRKPRRDEGIDQPRHPQQVGELSREDEDGQCVDESDHHAARDEPHQTGDTHCAEDDLDDPGEEHRGDQVIQAVAGDQGRHHQRHRPGGGGDHRRTAADDGDRHRHRERGEQAHSRVDPGDDRERDGLGDERERDHETGEDLGTQAPRGAQGRQHRLLSGRSQHLGRHRRLDFREVTETSVEEGVTHPRGRRAIPTADAAPQDGPTLPSREGRDINVGVRMGVTPHNSRRATTRPLRDAQGACRRCGIRES